MNISSILDKAARLWPDREAVICGDCRLTYRRLAERVGGLAAAFRSAGARGGDRVAVIHSNCHMFLEVYFAAARAGLILVPVNVRLSGLEIASVLEDSGPKLLVVESEFERKAHEALTAGRAGKSTVTTVFRCWGGAYGVGNAAGDSVAAEDERAVDVEDSAHRGGAIVCGAEGTASSGSATVGGSAGADKTSGPGGASAAGLFDGFEERDYETAIEEAAVRVLPPPSAADGDTAHLYYTSGTTGKPKGVRLTHSNIFIHALGTVAELRLADTDVWIHAAPMYHLADAWAVFSITMASGLHVMLPRFSPRLFLEAVEEHGVTLTNLVPTMLNTLVNEPGVSERDFTSLRCLLSGGAPISPELVRRIIETFRCEYIQTYGLTETSPYLTLSLLKEHMRSLPVEERFRYISRTGREFITVELKVVRTDGVKVARDDREVGEIWARGPTVSPGYWNRPDETASAYCEGWLKTGDLAVIDSEGYINIVDRLKDMIVSGGENVYSIEVENVLYKHPAVLEAAVLGAPDDKWGEAVKAFVALKPGVSVAAEELILFCRERIAEYKAPSTVEFLSRLPKTGSGKISKKKLRNRTP